MTFNLEKFIFELSEQFKEKLSAATIADLLDLKEQYNKDTPLSTGKRLIVNYIAFKGIKSSEEQSEYAGKVIDYSQELGTGINIWVAGNLKGKSSIFKIIKFALTGNNSIKQNIKSWIREIIVNFQIGDKAYTAYLNTEKRLRAYLINGSLRSVEEILQGSSEYLIEAKSESEYQESIQDFFFKQFSYYTLKWTQKHPNKAKNELLEVGASWSTYFMSILLESKDSGDMYGAQGKKIFEMLLGLELTFPINRLKVRADLLKDEMAKENHYKQKQASDAHEQVDLLNERLSAVNEELAEIDKVSTKQGSISNLLEQYDLVLDEIKTENEKVLEADEDIRRLSLTIQAIRNKTQHKNQESERLEDEISKLKRNILDLKEYMEIGIFFSNLDIKQCPNCSHNISEQRKQEVLASHKCYVCDHSIEEDTLNEDSGVYLEKIERMEKLLLEYQQEKEAIDIQAADLEIDFQQHYNHLETLRARRLTIGGTELLTNQLKRLETQINTEKIKKVNEDVKNSLISERAIIEYKLSQLQNNEQEKENEERIEDKISLLETAVANLEEMRFVIGGNVLSRLSELMLGELHDLGLTSVSKISISDKFDIHYTQDGQEINFNQIAEGEQLRAKIAFYLSLIQLDIEFNFGRHTRFLIIDSPGKEEADENYLQGFSSILKGIQDRFGDKLQIFIGTAERELEGVVSQQYVLPKNTFVF